MTLDSASTPHGSDGVGGAPSEEAPANLFSVVHQHRDLRRLLVAAAVSQIGDWAYNVALVVTVYQISHSGALVGATTVARVVPEFMMGPIGGMLADRYDRRILMISSDASRAILMVLFAAAIALRAPTFLLPVLAGLSSLVGAPYRTCVAAAIPRMVPDAQLGTANSARSLTTELSVVIGPLLEAGLIVVGSQVAAFVLNAGTFVLAAVLLTRISSDAFTPLRTGKAESLVEEVTGGLRALRGQAGTWLVCGADILITGVYGTASILLLFLSRDITGGDAGYGVLITATGAGGVLGALVAGRVIMVASPRALLVVSVCAAALPLGLSGLAARTSWFLPVVAALIVFGVAMVMIEIQADTILQRSIPPEAFGRTHGFVIPACYAAQALGAGIAPAAEGLLGLRGAFLAAAATLVLYAGGLLALGPRRTAAIGPGS